MSDLEIRLEACRLAIAACSRELPIDDRIAEIHALVMFFEALMRRTDAPSETGLEQPDYPKIGAR